MRLIEKALKISRVWAWNPSDLREALMEAGARNGSLNSRKIAAWIKRHLGTRKGGLCFEKAGTLAQATWRIRSLKAPLADSLKRLLRQPHNRSTRHPGR